MRQPERKLYTELEAVRRRVLGHAYLTVAARAAQAAVEAELYEIEERLLDGRPLDDGTEEVIG